MGGERVEFRGGGVGGRGGLDGGKRARWAHAVDAASGVGCGGGEGTRDGGLSGCEGVAGGVGEKGCGGRAVGQDGGGRVGEDGEYGGVVCWEGGRCGWEGRPSGRG